MSGSRRWLSARTAHRLAGWSFPGTPKPPPPCRGRRAPNPSGGAGVRRAGGVVGEGWPCRPGTDHAEIVALRQAGRSARGGTLYVTLEPCAHVGRTPPCVDAVKAAGIARCVVAIQDPHAIVDGRGLRALRRAGVQVEVGLMAEEVREALGGYL